VIERGHVTEGSRYREGYVSVQNGGMSGEAPVTSQRFERRRDVLSRTTPAGAVLLRVDAGADEDPTVVSGPGGDIWELLTVECTKDELIASLAARYGTSAEAVEGDLDSVLDALCALGFVDRLTG
jgi:hypothetical protein